MAETPKKDNEPAAIKIRIDRAGMGTVEVDGVNLAKYSRGVEFISTAGELSQCIINLCGVTEIEAETLLVIKKYIDCDMETGFIKAIKLRQGEVKPVD